MKKHFVFYALAITLACAIVLSPGVKAIDTTECEDPTLTISEEAACFESLRNDCRSDQGLTATERQDCVDEVDAAAGVATAPAGDGTDEADTPEELATPSGTDTITPRIVEITNFLSIGIGLVITGAMVVAGIQWAASGGDPQGTANAMKRMVSAGIALLLFIFGWAILNWLVPGGIF